MLKTILVNKENSISIDKINKIDKVKAIDCNNREILLEKNTFESFIKLKKYLLKKNIEIDIESVYRSIDYQENLTTELRERYGDEYIEKYVARPGYSEHHTGMAIDFVIMKDGKYTNDTNIELDNIYNTIHKELYKYGFILRYPKNKENITGYSYEPWHIRYVGEVPAKIIYENNLTLEEYLKDFGCVLYINKEEGVTSFDIVRKISQIFGIKRVGHSGTLDPLATGVLVVTVGKACKIVELLTSEDKDYEAEVKIGIETDTLDITGKILRTKKIEKIDNLEEVLNSFKKTYLQEVPIYSAIKVNGKKLYEYARNNIEVELPKKEVTIKDIKLLNKNKDTFTFKCSVSKGCYIRSLIRDIGTELNTYLTMSKLNRTRQGKVNIKDTNTIKDIENNNFKIHNIEDVLTYPIVEVDSILEKKLSNGIRVNNTWNIKDKVIFKYNNKIIGIYENYNNILKTWKNW